MYGISVSKTHILEFLSIFSFHKGSLFGGDVQNTKEQLKQEVSDLIGLKVMKRDTIERLKKEIIELSQKINDTYKKIDHIKKYENIQVSDHALIRWMERFHGIDFDTIREEVLTDRVKNNILTMQTDGTYERRVVKNGVIVTVLDIKN